MIYVDDDSKNRRDPIMLTLSDVDIAPFIHDPEAFIGIARVQRTIVSCKKALNTRGIVRKYYEHESLP